MNVASTDRKAKHRFKPRSGTGCHRTVRTPAGWISLRLMSPTATAFYGALLAHLRQRRTRSGTTTSPSANARPRSSALRHRCHRTRLDTKTATSRTRECAWAPTSPYGSGRFIGESVTRRSTGLPSRAGAVGTIDVRSLACDDLAKLEVRPVADRSCVLVIDDDDTVREVLRRYLMRDGHDVLEAADGSAGLELALDRNPDLLVLDLMLPGMDGLEVCRQIRRTSSVPIIMLTALGQVSDRVVGLEYGADDYVVKPFSPRELALRVGRVLDRSRASAGPATAQPQQLSTTDGELTADATSRIATCRGREISLTSREFDLLYFLLAAPGPGFRPR